jgi:ubiquinone biosynthesis monooxygenase Coq7
MSCSYDSGRHDSGTYIIRGEFKTEDVFFRAGGLDPFQLVKIRNGLKKLHTFEVMAVNIYKYQITSEPDEFNCILIQAMANEMTHVQDFQIKLYEYGTRPSPLRWAMWLFGITLGCTSRLLGRKYIIKTGIWTEKKAVEDYQKILDSAHWDTETRNVIKRNLADEYHHIDTFDKLLNH